MVSNGNHLVVFSVSFQQLDSCSAPLFRLYQEWSP